MGGARVTLAGWAFVSLASACGEPSQPTIERTSAPPLDVPGMSPPSAGDRVAPPPRGDTDRSDAGVPERPRARDAGILPPLELTPIVGSCEVPPLPSSSAYRLVEDVVFHTDGGTELAMDIALPVVPGPHPAALAFHGGAWAIGQRSFMRATIVRLAGMGYVAAAPSYRLFPEDTSQAFPIVSEDARCAVRFLKDHAGAFDIDTERMIALGVSAGGHLAGVLGALSEVPGLDGACASRTSPRCDRRARCSDS